MTQRKEQRVVVSAHRARLQPSLELEKRAWELNQEWDQLVCLVVDALRAAAELRSDPRQLLEEAERQYNTTKAFLAKQP